MSRFMRSQSRYAVQMPRPRGPLIARRVQKLIRSCIFSEKKTDSGETHDQPLARVKAHRANASPGRSTQSKAQNRRKKTPLLPSWKKRGEREE